MRSLFSEDELLELEVARCHACKLDMQCRSPHMPVHGRGERKILLVGEAPGKTEDEQGVPFVGRAGQLLRRLLSEVGIDMDDCWRTNAAICRPPGNKLPAKAVDHCRPNLMRTIRELRPDVVVPLGGSAVEAVLQPLWGEAPGAVGQWVGWRIPTRDYWVCPTWHPSFLLRDERNKALELWLKRHLAACGRISGPPWPDGQSEYQNQVECVYGQAEASEAVLGFLADGRPVAWDLETDRLKPDHQDASVRCCGVSDGRRTVVFPWHGPVIKAMRELLRSTVPKIGANIKFEDRWCRRLFGHGVRGWAWDVMQMAHVLDNRPGITSVEFQAFVRLGVRPWGSKIKPLLEATAGNERNRIKDIPLSDLMEYCGMDALMEMKIYESQRGEL